MNRDLAVETLALLAVQDASLVSRRINALQGDEARQVLQLIGEEAQAKLLPRLDPNLGAGLIKDSSPETIGRLLGQLEPKDAARLLARLDTQSRQACLQALPEALRKEMKLLLSYPADTAGARMDPRAVLVQREDSVESALQKARASGKSVFEVLVVENDARLAGSAEVSALALAEPGSLVQSVMKSKVASVQALSPIEEAVDLFTRDGHSTLAVTHVDGTVVGVLRADRLTQAAAEEVGDDLLTMVGADPEERALSGVGLSVRKRLPWLGINLLTAFLASAVVGIFEGTIAKVSALAVLLPVVAGQSGNTGAQAMAVAMRGLAVREILPRHWAKVMFKEIQVGLLNGLAVAVATGLSVWWWSKQWALGAVIAGAMVIAMGIASASGALVPLALSAMGRDPAQSSSIVLTTITDIFGFFAFLGLATMFMSLLVG